LSLLSSIKKQFEFEIHFATMDSIKSKMLTLSQSTQEATARSLIYEEEFRKNNEVADRFEEQVLP
jgi:hypothetical protein